MSEPSISIAMCTYNGEKYVREQLDSFVEQQRRPDELIVCDDASTDRTADIIRSFAAEAPFHVRVVVHPRNIGRMQNFSHAVSLCTRDIIFLSDQDDVWHVDKIAKMSGRLWSNPAGGGVFCDATITDADLKPIGRSFFEHFGVDQKVQERVRSDDAFALLVRSPPVVQGAALAFRASLRPLLLPISPEWGQDSWIAALLTTNSELLPLNEQLLKYRRHGDNVNELRARSSPLKKLTRKIRAPRLYYQGQWEAVNYHLRQLDDIGAQLARQSDPVRLSKHVATIARRREQLLGRRRAIKRVLTALFSAP
jgi:glycosyltransferase involved in cell wall biosynthesis